MQVKPFYYLILAGTIILMVGAIFYVVIQRDNNRGREAPRNVLPEAAEVVTVGESVPWPSQEEIPAEQEPAAEPVPSEPATPEQPPVQAPPGSPQPPAHVAKKHFISIGENSFTPKLITISVGDTVVWTNNDTTLHWPASDPHPTHTGLSDFDPFADLAPGESFSYTFRVVGAFGYHDHTQAVVDDIATMTGAVRVIPLEE